MVPYPSHSQMRNVDANRTLCSVETLPRNDARHQQRNQIKAKGLAKEQIVDRPSEKVPPADRLVAPRRIEVVADGHGAQRVSRHPESGERIAEEDPIRQAFGEESTTRDRDTREDGPQNRRQSNASTTRQIIATQKNETSWVRKPIARSGAPRYRVRPTPFSMHTVPTARKPAARWDAPGTDLSPASRGITQARITEACVCQFNLRGQSTNQATDARIANDARRVGRQAAISDGPNARKLARIARIIGMRNSHQLIGGLSNRNA